MLEIFDYDTKMADETYYGFTNVNSTSETVEEVSEPVEIRDFKGSLLDQWDEVCEIELVKNGMKSIVVAKWGEYQDVLDIYKNWHQEKLSYYEKGEYIKFGDPKWVMRKEEI